MRPAEWSALDQARRKCSTFEDVAAWCKEHPEIFGARNPIPVEIERVEEFALRRPCWADNTWTIRVSAAFVFEDVWDARHVSEDILFGSETGFYRRYMRIVSVASRAGQTVRFDTVVRMYPEDWPFLAIRQRLEGHLDPE